MDIYKVYKIENRINGMVYIGKTKRSIICRWKQHCNDAKRKTFHYGKLWKAINEFGSDNFDVEQIDCVESETEANEKEAYWIQRYNSIENGYNVARGGNDGGGRKKVKAIEDDIIFCSITEAALYYGVSVEAVRSVIDKNHLTSCGQHWISA